MGQKINPIGFRLGVSRGWQSRWYANNRNFAPMLAEDIKVRDFLKGKLAHASVGRVVIERPAKDARITIFSARPGVVIGKKGEEIEALKAELRRIMGVNQVHYAMVAVFAMGFGLFTPPFGVGFYLACAIGRVSPDVAIRAPGTAAHRDATMRTTRLPSITRSCCGRWEFRTRNVSEPGAVATGSCDRVYQRRCF